MVSDSLASHGFYRKHLNVARYWATKGKDKHNLDARTPTAIGRALSETSRTSKMTVKLPWTPGKPSRQSPEVNVSCSLISVIVQVLLTMDL